MGLSVWKTRQVETTAAKTAATNVTNRYQEWQKAYLAGSSSQKYVKTNNGSGSTQTLSEAQGYGMLATVYAAKKGLSTQTTFDQLTSYYLAHRISSSTPLMAWRQTMTDGKMVSSKTEQNSATDGDLDIAYALILADQQWGSKGSINYQSLAKKLIAAIKKDELNQTTHLPKVGNWATTSTTENVVRTSDLITLYFKKFASYTGDKSWQTVASQSQRTLVKLSNQHQSGLMADFVTISGTDLTVTAVKPQQVATNYDADYAYNACRVPWRLAASYKASPDATTKKVLTKMLTFFAKKSKITAVYTLDGKAVNSYTNLAFTTPVYYAAKIMGNTTLTTKYNGVLAKTITSNNYYPETIQLLMLLQLPN